MIFFSKLFAHDYFRRVVLLLVYIMLEYAAFTLHAYTVVKVDRRIRWHYTTTILRFRIGAWLTRYRNCKFHNFACTVSRHADGISRYSVPYCVPPSAGPLLPLCLYILYLSLCTQPSKRHGCDKWSLGCWHDLPSWWLLYMPWPL